MTLMSVAFSSQSAQKLHLKVVQCLAKKSARSLNHALLRADPVDLPCVLRRLNDKERISMWHLLGESNPKLAANLIDHYSDAELLELVSQLPESTTVELFEFLRSEGRRLLLSELPEELSNRLTNLLPAAWHEEERAALIYSSDSVGGISKSEVLKLDENATVDSLSRVLSSDEHSLARLEWRYVYLQSAQGRYLGGLKIRDVLRLSNDALLKHHTDSTIPEVAPEASLSDLKSILNMTLHPVVAVVDTHGFQIGIVGFKHLNDALYQRSKQALLEQSGVLGGDESRAMPMLKRNLRRLAFLLPSVGLSYAAISIIAAYELIIEQVAVLAAILPLVANLSGAAGNQSVAVSIRELSTGQISAKDLLYVVMKELPIGMLNGLFIGCVLAVLTLVMFGDENLALPLVITLAYSFSSALAVMIGGGAAVGA
ncbi:magnesium transporter [Motilimonas sp. KMU-193]|uniref:magnesium transporter n=1 Tax=Motilimonas sp. KMU-193 TaxID=3388668 RepID=UPI00396B0BD4